MQTQRTDETTPEIKYPCPKCGAPLEYDEFDGGWHCPNGHGGFWEDEDLLRAQEYNADRIASAQLREQIRWSIGRCPGEIIPPVPVRNYNKSSSRSGRRKKRDPLKKLRQELWHLQ